MKRSAMQLHRSKLRARVEWWRSVEAELEAQGEAEMAEREFVILNALNAALASPLGNAMAAEGLGLDRETAKLPPDERQEFIDLELARLMVGWAYQLGKGRIWKAGRPPIDGDLLAEIEQEDAWESVPVPPGCPGFDRGRPM